MTCAKIEKGKIVAVRADGPECLIWIDECSDPIEVKFKCIRFDPSHGSEPLYVRFESKSLKQFTNQVKNDGCIIVSGGKEQIREFYKATGIVEVGGSACK